MHSLADPDLEQFEEVARRGIALLDATPNELERTAEEFPGVQERAGLLVATVAESLKRDNPDTGPEAFEAAVRVVAVLLDGLSREERLNLCQAMMSCSLPLSVAWCQLIVELPRGLRSTLRADRAAGYERMAREVEAKGDTEFAEAARSNVVPQLRAASALRRKRDAMQELRAATVASTKSRNRVQPAEGLRPRPMRLPRVTNGILPRGFLRTRSLNCGARARKAASRGGTRAGPTADPDLPPEHLSPQAVSATRGRP
jgi:hypothetical protein